MIVVLDWTLYELNAKILKFNFPSFENYKVLLFYLRVVTCKFLYRFKPQQVSFLTKNIILKETEEQMLNSIIIICTVWVTLTQRFFKIWFQFLNLISFKCYLLCIFLRTLYYYWEPSCAWKFSPEKSTQSTQSTQ